MAIILDVNINALTNVRRSTEGKNTDKHWPSHAREHRQER